MKPFDRQEIQNPLLQEHIQNLQTAQTKIKTLARVENRPQEKVVMKQMKSSRKQPQAKIHKHIGDNRQAEATSAIKVGRTLHQTTISSQGRWHNQAPQQNLPWLCYIRQGSKHAHDAMLKIYLDINMFWYDCISHSSQQVEKKLWCSQYDLHPSTIIYLQTSYYIQFQPSIPDFQAVRKSFNKHLNNKQHTVFKLCPNLTSSTYIISKFTIRKAFHNEVKSLMNPIHHLQLKRT